MTSLPPEALAHHVAKWQRREPEMALAEPFCPVGQRPVYRAWGALLFELREAMFELSDVRVTTAKTAWWAEELLALSRGQGRHALTTALPGPAAPWPRLARAVVETPGLEARPADAAQAVAGLQPLAVAVAEVEAALFGAVADDGATAAAAVHFLRERLPRGLAADDAARLPMNLLARHGCTAGDVAAGRGEALLRDWALELLALAPTRLPSASLYRRLRSRFDRARLQRLADGRGFAPAPAPQSLWQGWRAARGR